MARLYSWMCCAARPDPGHPRSWILSGLDLVEHPCGFAVPRVDENCYSDGG
jgi:hypothetical protein